MRERKDLTSRQVPGMQIGFGVLALWLVAFLLILLNGAQSARSSGAPAIQITPNSGPYHTVTVVNGPGICAA